MLDPADIIIPPSIATVTVKAIDTARPGAFVPAALFLHPVVPGKESLIAPVYAFLIEHPNGRRVMYDLGPRKDQDKYAPAVRAQFSDDFDIAVDRDVTEQLISGGIALETIDSVIWSHTHLDHTGDMSKFPQSTKLIAGPGYDRRTYPSDPEALLLDTDFAGREVVELSFEGSPALQIGSVPAIDFFDDGSLYLLDLPGHCPGHIGALARVADNSFVLLGGDTCHHAGQLRPNPYIKKNYPYPEEIIASARKVISTKYFPDPVHTDGTGNFDLDSRSTPLLTLPEKSIYSDRATSIVTQEKLAGFDAHPDIFLVTAHDITLPDIIDLFPKSLNHWKEKGWKEKAVWAFLRRDNKGFRFSAPQ